MQTLKERVDELQPGTWLHVLGNHHEYAVTGTKRIGIMPDRTIKVMYADSHIEERKANADSAVLALNADGPTILALVAFVEAGRKK